MLFCAFVIGVKLILELYFFSDTRGRKALVAPDRTYSEIRLCKNVSSRYNVWAVVTRFAENINLRVYRGCHGFRLMNRDDYFRVKFDHF